MVSIKELLNSIVFELIFRVYLDSWYDSFSLIKLEVGISRLVYAVQFLSTLINYLAYKRVRSNRKYPLDTMQNSNYLKMFLLLLNKQI